MIVKLLTEHGLEFLSLKGGCTGSSESTLVTMTHCWKSRITAHIHLERFIFWATTLMTNIFTVALENFMTKCLPNSMSIG